MYNPIVSANLVYRLGAIRLRSDAGSAWGTSGLRSISRRSRRGSLSVASADSVESTREALHVQPLNSACTDLDSASANKVWGGGK